MELEGLEKPPEAALEWLKEGKSDRLLDDIRDVNMAGVPIEVQSKGVGIIWKLRAFKKIAILYHGQETEKLFFGTLEVMHMDTKFKGFETEADAVAWLKA
jgi:hypothetical protein